MMWRFLFIFFFLVRFANAQEDFAWWNEKHHWDGITPWNQYMTISAAYMGPNALPVPEIEDGMIDSMAQLNISYDYHKSKGDKTQDVFLKGILPLFDSRVSVELSVVPLEWYEMDTITRDERAVRTESGEGSAG